MEIGKEFSFKIEFDSIGGLISSEFKYRGTTVDLNEDFKVSILPYLEPSFTPYQFVRQVSGSMLIRSFQLWEHACRLEIEKRD